MTLSRNTKWWIGAGLLGLAVVIAGGSILYAVGHNAQGLRQVVEAQARLEHRNVASLRRAAFRICARADLERAEIHAAYQQQSPMADPAVLAREPILAILLQAAEANREKSLRRVRRNLPILNCSPNLRGNAAVPLSAKRQARYVARYLANQLDPTPGDTRLDSSEVGDVGTLGLADAAQQAAVYGLAAPKAKRRTGVSKGRSRPDRGSGGLKPHWPSEPPAHGGKPPSSPTTPTPPPKKPSEPPSPQPEPPVVPHPDPGGVVNSIVNGVGQIVQQLLP